MISFPQILIWTLLLVSSSAISDNETSSPTSSISLNGFRRKSLYLLYSPEEDNDVIERLQTPINGGAFFNGKVNKIHELKKEDSNIETIKNKITNTNGTTLKLSIIKSPRKGNLEREEITERNSIYDPFGSNNDVSIYRGVLSPSVSDQPGYNPYLPNDERSDDLEAFTAKKANRFSTIFGSKIVFQETLDQLGEGWDQAKSEFSPSIPGYFFFTFSAVSDRFSHFRITLKKNNEDVVSAYADVSGFQTASNSVILQLGTSDRVYLQLQEGRIFEATTSSRSYTTFTGFRIL